MRNQQIKKVNRVFFSGQDEDKRKWIEGMAAEGWQLLSEGAFVYSFQRITSEKELIIPSYRSILGLDLQKSMPIIQDSRQDWVAQLSEKNPDQTIQNLSTLVNNNKANQPPSPKSRHLLLGTLALAFFLTLTAAKLAIISQGDFISLIRWQFLTGLLLVVISLAFGMVMLVKGFLKILALQCKSNK